MNGDEYGPNLSDFNPSWMEDGGGITGEQGEPNFDSNAAWDTRAWSRVEDQPEGNSGSPCGPESDTTKLYVYVKKYVDGQWVCSWMECGPA